MKKIMNFVLMAVLAVCFVQPAADRSSFLVSSPVS